MNFKRKNQSLETLSAAAYASEATYAQSYPTTLRTFAFVDVCGYTTYTQKYGIHAAARMLHEFRNAVRIVVGRHNVGVAKWMGDGVLLVGSQATPVFEAVAELNQLFRNRDFAVHSGMAMGSVIIFEGDDYIGSCVNIAARLAEYAQASEILCCNIPKRYVPSSLQSTKLKHKLTVRGIGELDKVATLRLCD